MSLPIHVLKIATPEGPQHIVTLLSPEKALKSGVPPEAIVGVMSGAFDPSAGLTPDRFIRNSVFVEFLHGVIARHVPTVPACLAEARRLGKGTIVIVDHRTRTAGEVPPEDVIGVLEVKDGVPLPGSYRRGPRHAILSTRGFFQLDPFLESRLLEAIDALPPAVG